LCRKIKHDIWFDFLTGLLRRGTAAQIAEQHLAKPLLAHRANH
jgi:hypothetical protein